jgi:hypothetical protein
MTISLFDYQKKAISQLKTGSILRGGVGSGKSLTALGYFYEIECGGSLTKEEQLMAHPKDLYVITTARKRDSLDWEKECAHLSISSDRESSISGIKLVVDSWNNIGKYKEIKNAFFIFDEQKLVGYGSWVKSFLRIAKHNGWILLSATPGDTWMDYVPVFIANGFFKNKTEFTRKHVVYNTFSSYPKIDRYVDTDILFKYKRRILVKMEYEKKTIDNIVQLVVPHDKDKFNQVYKERWNPYKNLPIKAASEACYTLRRVVNSDPSRLEAILELVKKHRRLIVFYNFDYELEILRTLKEKTNIPVAEYNGHYHEEIPQSESWIYLAQYVSAGEAWNCIETNAIVLYSRNYSYKITTQAMGRIDRQNTPFQNLYYYFLTSNSSIDRDIQKAYVEKKNFNERRFSKKTGLATETYAIIEEE